MATRRRTAAYATAVEAIHARGFRLDGGWENIDPHTIRTGIDVTREYLDFVARVRAAAAG